MFGGGRRTRSLSIPALVLTYDRNAVLCAHMMLAYDRVWQGHPLHFVVPTQGDLWDGWYRPEMMTTVPAPADILGTMDALLAPFDDDDWVYWCIDDKYPIQFDVGVVEGLAGDVLATTDPSVTGFMFARCRKLMQRPHVDPDDVSTTRSGVRLIRRNDYNQIWIHQFLRARVLRSMFARFPRRSFPAKGMDQFTGQVGPDYRAWPVPDGQNMFVAETCAAVFGESTVAGALTNNCAASMAGYGFDLPSTIPLADTTVTMGSIPG